MITAALFFLFNHSPFPVFFRRAEGNLNPVGCPVRQAQGSSCSSVGFCFHVYVPENRGKNTADNKYA